MATTEQPKAAAPPAEVAAEAQAKPAAEQKEDPANASLYVGDLHTEVTEANLYEKFNAIGPVSSIRVCRDAITRRSLGYAYVNFNQAQHAEIAMDQFNFDEMRGKPIRIMWSNRDPSVRRSGVGNIFIKNLHKDIDNKTLYDTFSAFGAILSCKVAEDENGERRGFGMVHYETAEGAQQAIEKVNGMLLNDQKVFVGPFKSRKERFEEYEEKARHFTNVFVKNLDESIDEEGFAKMFEEFGPITSKKLMMKDPEEEGKPATTNKGFGFVAFENAEDAGKAVEAMNGKEIGGKALYCGRAQKRSERAALLRREYHKRRLEMQNKVKGVNLYVKNLDESINDDALRQAFTEFGTITSAKVMTNDKGESAGFGFVCFSAEEEATRAVTEMNNKILVSKPLYVALAQRKEQRERALAMQRNQRMTQMRMQPGAQMAPAGMFPGPQQGGIMYLPQAMGQMPRGGFAFGQVPRGPTGPRFMQQGVPIQYQRPMPGMAMPGVPMATRGGRGGGRGMGKGGRQPGPAQFRQQVRNMPGVPQQAMPQQVMPMVGQPGGPMLPPTAAAVVSAPPPAQADNFASQLASASEGQQKQMLGEKLYPKIQKMPPPIGEAAAKITGMLLEMDNEDLLILLEDASALRNKVNEAVKVLDDYKNNAQ